MIFSMLLPQIRVGLLIYVLFVFFPIHAQVALVPIWTNLPTFDKPVGIVKAPGLKHEYFILEQRGGIFRVIESGSDVKRYFFGDLSGLVSQKGWETGLLGMTFHPDFRKNGLVYLSYTTGEGKGLMSYISAFHIDLDRMVLRSNSAETILKVNQPYSNHNGGAIAFGPDGFLYFSWGDGGSAGDPQNFSQNLGSLLGKIHRIDVNKSTGDLPYSIPSDNPFRKTPGARPEIYANGLRNVWQMEIEQSTGLIWAGDVGQSAFEEINVVEKGRNYGWRLKEGLSDYKTDPGSKEKLTAPFWFYSQEKGDKSVTGGRLYKGKNKAWLNTYWCADYISGRIWSLDTKTAKATLQCDAKPNPIHISCFGEDDQGELLIASHEEGKVYRLENP